MAPFNPIPDETVSLTGANVRFEGSTARAVSSLAVFGPGAAPFPLPETQTLKGRVVTANVVVLGFFLFVYSPNATGSVETLDDQTETESVVSFRRERPRHRESMEQHGERTLPPTRQWKDAHTIKECWSQGV